MTTPKPGAPPPAGPPPPVLTAGLVTTGMVLAAGRGLRLRPITDKLPKPLVPVGGRTLLDHAIDRLEAVGVERVVVNVHYLGEMITAHLAARTRPRILISEETTPLETGGAVAHARALLGTDPFFVVNGDSLWLDGKVPALTRLARAWDGEHMDALIVLQRTATAIGYDGNRGDFFLDQLGRAHRRRETEIAPYLFSGIQLLSPRLFDDVPSGPFSLNLIYDRAAEAGRLMGLVHDGEWYHVGTPSGLADTAERLETSPPDS
ncbi:MAG TPA: nucleotidyltransferase family protein [Stellaceae bacterium]|nr:nucleotidyltransferase family protein [Stellaceae bacterium]